MSRRTDTNSRRAAAIALATLIVFACTLVAATGRAHAAHDGHGQSKAKTKATTAVRYECPMHPEVKSAKRGSRCPKCGMNLTPAKVEADKVTNVAADVPTVEVTNAAAETNATKKTEAVQAPRIPDASVFDQNGRKLRFYTDLVKGKTVAVNFVFTTCTTICPPLSATFRKVQQELGGRVGEDVELISVSVDPATDTPERLKAFAAKFGAGKGWTFVTGSKGEIDRLLTALGANTGSKMNHTPMILVGNESSAYWTRAYGLSPASSIVSLIKEASAKPDAATAQVPLPVTNERADAATGAGQNRASANSTNVRSSAGGAKKSYFPNTALLTQDGERVKFYDDVLKGKIVLINFMFTTCGGVCTPMTANLSKVQKYLGEEVGKEVVMVSISVDPVTDTPDVLKKYAAAFKAPRGWYFLTGKKEDVDAVLAKLGGYVDDKSRHSSVLIIGDEAAGDWMKTHAMSKPAEIAEAVRGLIAARGKAGAAEASR